MKGLWPESAQVQSRFRSAPSDEWTAGGTDLRRGMDGPSLRRIHGNRPGLAVGNRLDGVPVGMKQQKQHFRQSASVMGAARKPRMRPRSTTRPRSVWRWPATASGPDRVMKR